MTRDGPEWFAPKRFGYGAGIPISWQGWLVTFLYAALLIGTAIGFAHKPVVVMAVGVPATIALIIVTGRTTRGGWRWRWGRGD